MPFSISNKINIMTYLLQIGADINSFNDEYAKDKLNMETLKFLIEHNRAIHPKTIMLLLFKCFTNDDDTNNIEYLINYGSNLAHIFERDSCFENDSVRNKNDILHFNSLIEHVVSVGKINQIKFLAENCLELLLPEIDRLFVIACANGQCEIAMYLINLDANMNTFDKALISAIYFGHLNIVNLLISLEIDLHSIKENLFSVLISTNFRYKNLIENNTIFRNDMFIFGKDKLEILKLLMKHNLPVLDNIFSTIQHRTLETFYNVEFFTYCIANGWRLVIFMMLIITKIMFYVIYISIF